MSIEITCPSCGQPVVAQSHDSPPARCPNCGSRMACPRCGSALSRHPTATCAFRCTKCEFDLAGLETVAFKPTAGPGPTRNGDVQVDITIPVQGFDLLEEIPGGGMSKVF